jgi:hypothetical protein
MTNSTKLKTFLRTCFFLFVVLTFAAPVCSAADPLREEQIIQMATDTLKDYPSEVIKIVNQRGVNFFPTRTAIKWLERSGVSSDIISAVKQKAASQMRIKVCRFQSSDPAISNELANAMIRSLTNAKTTYIEPFGIIPLDNEPCAPLGFDATIKPKPNTFYLLIEGWIRKTSSGYTVDAQTIYRDLEGRQHPLPDAPDQPNTFTTQTLRNTADRLVEWSLRTTRKYAET